MTVLEIARVESTDGDAFAVAAVAAVAALRRAPGCHGAKLLRCLERPDEFVLEVEWESVAAHLGFRESELFGEYRAPLAGLLAGPPEFAHFEPQLVR